MNDLISRKALVKEILALRDRIPRNWNTGDWIRGGLHKALRCVETIPAVDAEPVRRGRWEQYPGPNDVRCTHCKVEFDKYKMPTVRNYCPNCGAKMEGE